MAAKAIDLSTAGIKVAYATTDCRYKADRIYQYPESEEYSRHKPGTVYL